MWVSAICSPAPYVSPSRPGSARRLTAERKIRPTTTRQPHIRLRPECRCLDFPSVQPQPFPRQPYRPVPDQLSRPHTMATPPISIPAPCRRRSSLPTICPCPSSSASGRASPADSASHSAVSEVSRSSGTKLPLKCPRLCDTSTKPPTGVNDLGRIHPTRHRRSHNPRSSTTSPSKRQPCRCRMFHAHGAGCCGSRKLRPRGNV